MDKYFKHEIKIHCDDTGETATGMFSISGLGEETNKWKE